MNILLINHYAGSDKYGMEFRPFYMGREWVKAGHDVTVVAATYSHLRRVNPAYTREVTEEIIDGVRYVWIRTPPYTGNNLSRLCNVVAFCRRLSKHAKAFAERYKPDAVVSSSTYPNNMRQAVKLANFAGADVFFEIHDLWPLSLMELYHFGAGNPAMQYLQRAEDYAFAEAKRIISILPDAAEHVAERGADVSKFVYIPNGVVLSADAKREPAPEQHARVIAQLKEQGKFVAMYLGGFAEANALEDLVESSPKLAENVAVVLIGEGFKKEQLMRTAKMKGYRNLVFLPGVKKTEVTAVQRLADCLYIGARRSALYRFGVGMNKLYDYMLSARPVIYGIEASNDPVSDAGCGLTIEPENAEAIAQAVNTLSGMDAAELDRMGQNGYEYVLQNHDYAKLAKRFADVLQGKD